MSHFPDEVHRAVHRLHDGDLADRERDPVGFDPRHVEDVVDDGEQIVAARTDVAAVIGIAWRAERAVDLARHQLGKSDDGIERRAQFVAHIGEEFGFRLVGGLGLGLLVEVAFGQIGELLGLQLQGPA